MLGVLSWQTSSTCGRGLPSLQLVLTRQWFAVAAQSTLTTTSSFGSSSSSSRGEVAIDPQERQPQPPLPVRPFNGLLPHTSGVARLQPHPQQWFHQQPQQQYWCSGHIAAAAASALCHFRGSTCSAVDSSATEGDRGLAAGEQHTPAEAAAAGDTPTKQYSGPSGRVFIEAATLPELLQLVQQHSRDMSGIAVAAAYSRLGKLCQRDAALASSADTQQLLQHLDQLLPSVQQQLGPRKLSNIIWACARFRHIPMQLLAALEQQEQQLQRLLSEAEPQHLANMTWACGQLGYCGEHLPPACLQQAVLLLQQGHGIGFNCQALCNLSWSAAVLDMRQQVPAELRLVEACRSRWDSLTAQELHQLYQVHLWLLDCQLLPEGGQKGLRGVLSEQQLEQCRSRWEQDLKLKAVASKASIDHQAVFSTLQQLPASTWKQQPVMEQRTADGAFSIDIAAVIAAGVQLAIEVDEPSHCVNPGNMLDGPTQYRNRALAARGYRLISIPYWEWQQLAKQDGSSYLLGRLAAAGAAK